MGDGGGGVTEEQVKDWTLGSVGLAVAALRETDQWNIGHTHIYIRTISF